jgi:preprotein translocase subunit SecG
MSTLLSILIILTCAILILAVLVQNPKGGGLASGFTAGSQVMGVRRTADFLEKATWTLAILLFVFSIATASSAGKPKGNSTDGTSQTKDRAGDLETTPPASNKNASPFGAPQTAPTGAPAPVKK